MIVTVTPNASLDLTYVLAEGDALSRTDTEVHRAVSVGLEASGKGVNVTRALALGGVPSVAVYPSGGTTGRHLGELLAADGVRHRPVPVAGATRVNTSILQPTAPTTKVNAPGVALSEPEIDALLAVTAQELDGGAVWLAVCGSLPPGTDAELVGRLVRLAHDHGARCAVDSSGAPLGVALTAGADLLAPNAAELAEVAPEVARALAARPGPPTHDGFWAAARAVAAERGCELLVSLGADGAMWTDGTTVLHARGPAVVPVNTAGAGDALLAGWLSCPPGVDPGARLRTAVLWGRTACLAPTTVAGPPTDVEAVAPTVGVRRVDQRVGRPGEVVR